MPRNPSTWLTLAALAATSCVVQAWQIESAVLPAPDAVRYVLSAQGMARDGFLPGLAVDPEQPFYPWLIWQTWSLATMAGWADSADWGRCAQIAAAAPLVLAVVPVFFLLRKLVGAR